MGKLLLPKYDNTRVCFICTVSDLMLGTTVPKYYLMRMSAVIIGKIKEYLKFLLLKRVKISKRTNELRCQKMFKC